MLEFDIQRFTRKCHASGRELAAGESFYSVLVADGPNVVRHDFAENAWQGPPENAVGWWKSQVPSAAAKKMQMAPGEVMLQYFQEIVDRPDKEDECYVLALLMIRRRVLRHERTDTDEQGREIAVLQSPKNNAEYRTPVVMPSPERAVAIQAEFERLLYSHT